MKLYSQEEQVLHWRSESTTCHRWCWSRGWLDRLPLSSDIWL